MAFGLLGVTRGIQQRSQGFSIDWATRHRRTEWKDKTMLATAGALLAGLAVFCVMLEATWPAAVFGVVGMWMIGHAA